MQVLFLAITLRVVGHHLRERRRVTKASDNNAHDDSARAAAITQR